MKSLFLLTVLAVPMLVTGCVEHEVVVHRGPYYHPYHRDVVVVEPAPVGVVYYTDHHGRYYWRHHHRVYVRVY
ncbi:hypothetical protein CfE428DRAFT_1590 [Chthoniobacter flavus Ellin428]|uniref:Lipoprotein n=1 Tax=Chthoniobacter flavus Ellin428 TaxID=497964 RepID=B4CWX7_9BACT|nr:hypothetical protein [Chthoniobacter flavus]EDY21297.1 hypothetical protein CfE428DRAFT_1590 [Chthoniobacter flavus Ellin428]TCO84933.1 hypothetical protein EV701_13353 [Chthoniobacter flavus]